MPKKVHLLGISCLTAFLFALDGVAQSDSEVWAQRAEQLRELREVYDDERSRLFHAEGQSAAWRQAQRMRDLLILATREADDFAAAVASDVVAMEPSDPQDEPAVDPIEPVRPVLGVDEDLQAAIDDLADGETLRVQGPRKWSRPLIIRDKTGVTIEAVGERVMVIGGIELHGRLTDVMVRGFAADRNMGGSGLRLGNGTGFRVYIDGVTFYDGTFNGNTFGISLLAYNPRNENYDGEFVRGLRFVRCNVAWNHTPESVRGKHSSGLYADRLEDLAIIDSFFYRNGHHPAVPGAVEFAQNQGIYYDGENGPLTLQNVGVVDSSYCSIQVRNHAPLDADRVVGLLNTNSMFFGNGELRDFLFWKMTPFEAGGRVYGNTLLDGQDSIEASRERPVRFRNGVVAEVAEGPMAPNTFAMAFRDGQAVSDDGKGPRTYDAFGDLEDVRIVGFEKPFNKPERVVRSASVVVSDGWGPYRSPAEWPGGVEAYIRSNTERKLGEWDPAVHGAEAMLRFVGVIDAED